MYDHHHNHHLHHGQWTPLPPLSILPDTSFTTIIMIQMMMVMVMMMIIVIMISITIMNICPQLETSSLTRIIAGEM